jgi:hypothetical protein
MSDKLYQMNVSYQAVEDRLMLRINTLQGDEFRIWLTRRFTGLLMQLLAEHIRKSGGEPVVASAPETHMMLKQGALEKPYEEERVKEMPLGKTGILTSKMNYKITANSILVLEILPEQGQGITLNMNKSLIFMFYNLLMQGCSNSMWRLSLQVDAAEKIH